MDGSNSFMFAYHEKGPRFRPSTTRTHVHAHAHVKTTTSSSSNSSRSVCFNLATIEMDRLT